MSVEPHGKFGPGMKRSEKGERGLVLETRAHTSSSSAQACLAGRGMWFPGVVQELKEWGWPWFSTAFLQLLSRWYRGVALLPAYLTLHLCQPRADKVRTASGLTGVCSLCTIKHQRDHASGFTSSLKLNYSLSCGNYNCNKSNLRHVKAGLEIAHKPSRGTHHQLHFGSIRSLQRCRMQDLAVKHAQGKAAPRLTEPRASVPVTYRA